jgi:hypothetical protein
MVSAEHGGYVHAFQPNRCSFSDSPSFLSSAFDFEDKEDDESEYQYQGSLSVGRFDLARKSC